MYTVADTDYNVVILKTQKQVWEHIQQFRGIDGEIYTDSFDLVDKILFTEKLLRHFLQYDQPINIYTIGDSIDHEDWVIQISKHRE